jgi:hypothetical protein
MRRFDANGFQGYHHLMLIRLYPGAACSPVAIGISKYFPPNLRNIAKQISSPSGLPDCGCGRILFNKNRQGWIVLPATGRNP